VSAPSAESRQVLTSGLRLIVAPRPGSGLAAIELRVRVGSGDETEATAGHAHLLEHVVFKGADGFGPGAFDEAMELLGGEVVARTSRDATTYSVALPAENVGGALSLLGRMLQHPALRPGDLDAERPVIEAENALARSDAPRAALGALAAQLFTDDEPYGRPILGTAMQRRAATAATLKAFHADWYRPERMTLVIAGDITAERAADAARGAFPAPPSTSAPIEPITRIPHIPRLREQPAPPISQPALDARTTATLVLGWATAPAADARTAATLAVLAHILSAETGPLVDPLIREKKLALSLGADYLPQRGAGLFVLTLTAPPDRLEKARDTLLTLLARLREDGFDDALVAAARQQERRRILAETSTVEGRARRLGLYDAFDGPPDLEAQTRQRVDEVNADAVLAALRVRLRPERAATVLLGRATP
jgi:predicted Zn-dependent peptidase